MIKQQKQQQHEKQNNNTYTHILQTLNDIYIFTVIKFNLKCTCM